MKIDRAQGCLLGQLAGGALHWGVWLNFSPRMRSSAATLMVSESGWRYMEYHCRSTDG